MDKQDYSNVLSPDWLLSLAGGFIFGNGGWEGILRGTGRGPRIIMVMEMVRRIMNIAINNGDNSNSNNC